MLSRVIIRNFKSIGEEGVDLELKPLTILVGPNGGGKSSIVEGILLSWTGGGMQNGNVMAPWLGEELPPDLLLYKRKGDSSAYVSLIFRNSYSNQMAPRFTYTLRLDNAQYRWGLLPLEDGSFQEPPPETMPSDVWQRFREESESRYMVNRDRVSYISGTRGMVTLREFVSGEIPPSTGIHGEYLLAYLSKMFGSNEHRTVALTIRRWAERFGISSLAAGMRSQSGAGADYVEPDLGATLQLALASTGARQILTVIAQLFGAEPDSLIMIEEPEISLHPEAQVKLVEMFAEAIDEGKQVIITTHSHYLLLALTNVIQRELLKAEDVAVCEVKKEKERGTTAKRLPITQDGIIKGWVSSFAKVDSRLLKGRLKQSSRTGA